MWKDFIRNIVVIFQPNILRIIGFYVRHSASIYSSCPAQLELCRILITGQLPTSKLNLLEHLNMEFQLNCFQIFNEGHFEFKQKDSLKKKKRHD